MSPERKSHIGVAMSGGVDSTVTAALSLRRGHRVTGFFMSLAQPDLSRQLERVRRVADHLGIPLEVIDLRQAFEAEVLTPFLDCYLRGLTPNPCILCNPRIKFGRLLDAALAAGCDCLATGHYVRVRRGDDHLFHLHRGRDPRKDQSYFLCRLDQRQLSLLRTPLGEQTKDVTYEQAADLGLTGIHARRESQDVCFLQGRELAGFLLERCRLTGRELPPPGPIVTADGTEIGRHAGLHRYTVGQRRGISIPAAAPYYVLALEPATNTVVVGGGNELLRRELTVRRLNWLAGQPPERTGPYQVKIRYRHRPATAVVEAAGDRALVTFREPQQAVTPGQYAVFYRDDEVVGGGEISR